MNGALRSLAARHASGILEIDGDPSGTVYFDQGQITCARASWIPDIGARLLGVLRPPAESLDLLTGADEPDRDIGTFLIQRDYLSIGELATILRSVVVDTVIALTALADEDAFVSDIRFAPAGAHWAAAFSCLDLAWRCGMSLYEAIENLSALIAAGLCEPDPVELAVPAPDLPLSAPAGPLADWFEPVPPQPPLPRRVHSAPVLSASPVMAAEIRLADGIPAAFDVGPAPQDLLRRVLEGLRRS